jgi:hypothetical protein
MELSNIEPVAPLCPSSSAQERTVECSFDLMLLKKGWFERNGWSRLVLDR